MSSAGARSGTLRPTERQAAAPSRPARYLTRVSCVPAGAGTVWRACTGTQASRDGTPRRPDPPTSEERDVVRDGTNGLRACGGTLDGRERPEAESRPKRAGRSRGYGRRIKREPQDAVDADFHL